MAGYSEDAIRSAMAKGSKKLGYVELRPKQKAAVSSLLKGQDDVFVCQPTGSGSGKYKFVCFPKPSIS